MSRDQTCLEFETWKPYSCCRYQCYKFIQGNSFSLELLNYSIANAWSLVILKFVSAFQFLLLGLLREVLCESRETKPNWEQHILFVCLLCTNYLFWGMFWMLQRCIKCDKSFPHLRALNRVGWGWEGKGRKGRGGGGGDCLESPFHEVSGELISASWFWSFISYVLCSDYCFFWLLSAFPCSIGPFELSSPR